MQVVSNIYVNKKNYNFSVLKVRKLNMSRNQHIKYCNYFLLINQKFI